MRRSGITGMSALCKWARKDDRGEVFRWTARRNVFSLHTASAQHEKMVTSAQRKQENKQAGSNGC